MKNHACTVFFLLHLRTGVCHTSPDLSPSVSNRVSDIKHPAVRVNDALSSLDLRREDSPLCSKGRLLRMRQLAYRLPDVVRVSCIPIELEEIADPNHDASDGEERTVAAGIRLNGQMPPTQQTPAASMNWSGMRAHKIHFSSDIPSR